MNGPTIDGESEQRLREEGAFFAPARVRGTRGPRLLATVAVVALGGLIAVGALDRLGATPPQSDQVALTAPTNGAAVAPATPIHRDSRPPPHGAAASEHPIGGRFDALIALDVRPAGSHLFVHGDVYTRDIVRVRVKVEDSIGHVAARQAIDIPGGSTAFQLGAVPRFDAHFFLPDEVQADGYTVAATAIGADGKAMFTITRTIARSSSM